MAKKWSEVSQSPEFQALSPEDQEKAREQYFYDIVAPQVSDPEELGAIRQQFDADTRPKLPEEPGWGETLARAGRHTGEQLKAQVGGGLTKIGESSKRGAADTQRNLAEGDIPGAAWSALQGLPSFLLDKAVPGLKEKKAQLAETGTQMTKEAHEAIKNDPYNVEVGGAKYYVGHGTEVMLGNVLPMLATSIVTKNPNTGLALMGGQVYGQKYGQSRAEGRDPDQASMDAAVYALSEAITERLPIGEALKYGEPLLKKVLKTAGLEGGSEVINQLIQNAYDAGIVDEKTDLKEFLKEMTSDEAKRSYLDSLVIGAGVGGVMAGAAHPFTSRQEKGIVNDIKGIANNVAFQQLDNAQLEEAIKAGDQLVNSTNYKNDAELASAVEALKAEKALRVDEAGTYKQATEPGQGREGAPEQPPDQPGPPGGVQPPPVEPSAAATPPGEVQPPAPPEQVVPEKGPLSRAANVAASTGLSDDITTGNPPPPIDVPEVTPEGAQSPIFNIVDENGQVDLTKLREHHKQILDQYDQMTPEQQQEANGLLRQIDQLYKQAEQPVAPESQQTTQAQVDEMMNPESAKDAVLITPGSEMPANVPEGVERVEGERGTLLTTNPAKAESYRKDSSDKNVATLLGYSNSKEDVSQLARQGENVHALVVRNDAGVPIHEELATDSQLDSARKAVEQTFPGREVSVEAPDKQLVERAQVIGQGRATSEVAGNSPEFDAAVSAFKESGNIPQLNKAVGSDVSTQIRKAISDGRPVVQSEIESAAKEAKKARSERKKKALQEKNKEAGNPAPEKVKRQERSSAHYTVSTEDDGDIQVQVIRTEDGSVAIFRKDDSSRPIEHNHEFTKGKTDEDLLKYDFEPLGFIGAKKNEDGETQAAQLEEREGLVQAEEGALPAVPKDEEDKKKYVDPRLKRKDYRAWLKDTIDNDLVPGGGITLIPKPGAKKTSDTGDVLYDYGTDNVIRTPSVNQSWVQSLLAEEGVSVKYVRNAVEKALRGEKLGVKQERVVKSVIDQIKGERNAPENMESVRQRRLDAINLRRMARAAKPITEEEAQKAMEGPDYYTDEAMAGQIYEEDAYEPGWSDEARSLSELAREAAAIDETKTERILERGLPDPAAAKQLWEVIQNGQEQQQKSPEATKKGQGNRVQTEEKEGLTLKRETPEDLQRKEAAEKARQQQEVEAEKKAKADEAAKDFTLTGSNLPADVAAARGQKDLLAEKVSPEERAAPEGYKWLPGAYTYVRSEERGDRRVLANIRKAGGKFHATASLHDTTGQATGAPSVKLGTFDTLEAAAKAANEYIDEKLPEKGKPEEGPKGRRAKPGGERGLNGEWYNGGQFMPASAFTIKGAMKVGAGKRTKKQQLVEPGTLAETPDGKQSIYSALKEFVAEDGNKLRLKDLPPEAFDAHFRYGKPEAQELANRYNEGQRFYDKGEIDREFSGEHQLDITADQDVPAIAAEAKIKNQGSIEKLREALKSKLTEKELIDIYERLADAGALPSMQRTPEEAAKPGETFEGYSFEGPLWTPEQRRNLRSKDEAPPVIPKAQADAIRQDWKFYAKQEGRKADNSKKVIISLFDATGEISKPWKDAGYAVVQYDIKLNRDLFKFPPIADIMDLQQSGFEIVGVIAQPPCTCFTSSGARWWSERHDKADRNMVNKMFGPDAAELFSEPKEYTKALASLVDLVAQTAKPKFTMMENPVGRIAKEMGLPEATLKFEPHNFGDPYTKKTDLWGSFNVDLPTANVKPTDGSLMHKLWSTAEKEEGARSVTPEGFAYAFFVAQHQALGGSKYDGLTDKDFPQEVMRLGRTDQRSKTLEELRAKLEQMPARSLKILAKDAGIPVRKGEKQDLIDRLVLAREAIDTLKNYPSILTVEEAVKNGEISREKIYEWMRAVTSITSSKGLDEINLIINLEHLSAFGGRSRGFTLPYATPEQQAEIDARQAEEAKAPTPLKHIRVGQDAIVNGRPTRISTDAELAYKLSKERLEGLKMLRKCIRG